MMLDLCHFSACCLVLVIVNKKENLFCYISHTEDSQSTTNYHHIYANCGSKLSKHQIIKFELINGIGLSSNKMCQT